MMKTMKMKTGSAAKQHADKSATALEKLKVGTKVQIQHPSTKDSGQNSDEVTVQVDGKLTLIRGHLTALHCY